MATIISAFNTELDVVKKVEEGQIRRLKTILSPYLVPLISSLLKIPSLFFPLPYQLPHQNDVQ